eukprot:TRINITY_DN8402_c0_g1_i1.p1 TRINITY_DN8402_c0_g1~~TRINITY_DN8402_c0_g1_i1.p1  ORF type:complete len:189 (-),score=-17.56 TRINITY_DN8402_c0_g1_i1:59-625(-)
MESIYFEFIQTQILYIIVYTIIIIIIYINKRIILSSIRRERWQLFWGLFLTQSLQYRGYRYQVHIQFICFYNCQDIKKEIFLLFNPKQKYYKMMCCIIFLMTIVITLLYNCLERRQLLALTIYWQQQWYWLCIVYIYVSRYGYWMVVKMVHLLGCIHGGGDAAYFLIYILQRNNFLCIDNLSYSQTRF